MSASWGGSVWRSQRSAGDKANVNDIGDPGGPGFGVGIAPPELLPSYVWPLPGHDSRLSPNYGNYQDASGSVLCWIPAFFYRFAPGSNVPVVLPRSAFPGVAAANANGFALHRMFYDGGVEQPGCFIDKYKWSALNGIAVSVRNGAPLSSAAAHNGWGSALTGLTTADNNLGGAFKAAKTRGAAYFPASLCQHAALALLSLAHAAASTSTAYCAWYSASGVSAPRGCDNNALRSVDDASVVWQPDGYANCGLTGSAAPFAKSTHNGQECGVADLGGLLYEVAPGMTCVAASKNITGATQANPCVLTVVGHGFTTGDVAAVAGVNGMTQLNNRVYRLTVVDADHVSLDATDATGFTAYASGGTLTRGLFYAAKQSVRMRDFTGGNTLATDHFGATGAAAMMDPIDPNQFLQTAYSANNSYARNRGNGSAALLRGAVSGTDWVLDGLGLSVPEAVGAGINAFGNDQYYQTVAHELTPIAGGAWQASTTSGIWACYMSAVRTSAYDSVGGRCGLYLL